ncbi:hypothetical protein PRZ48_009781 [Zasmidium cellare]|uniref:Uncharacterized protein n=1 Tax=Zasmidium cellare TaxID=395010 RepID=A0ABR0EDX7_ZASCE|nr:hypothetical protein PRZ48_009781 [Zasmidium cellare]
MSKSLNSPTARLLQSSRLFSLPRPLPQPALETATSTGVYRASDSATLPYPVYQAIASPPSSRFRGDWGLKRALPARSARSSTPHIRVKAQDNFAHITDFESAADHTQTEAKWRQMGIPVVVRSGKEGYSGDTRVTGSAYDDHIDNTDPEAVSSAQRNAGRGAGESVQWKRWKSESPWLAGMQPGEFETYIQSRLKGRKGEFRKFMIERLVQQRVRDEERRLRDLGQRRALSHIQRNAILQEVITNYESDIKRLRDDHAVQNLASELTAAICDFLGLTGIQNSAENQVTARTERLQNVLTNMSSSEPQAPPSTHPAAGLSHIRSNAIMENHPFWGPQAQGSPVLARVVRPRHTAQGSDNKAKLGVGGVVTSEDGTTTAWQGGPQKALDFENTPIEHFYDKHAQRMVEHIEVDLPGGNKVWVHPDSATVDDQGRVQLRVRKGDSEAIAVARGDVESIHEAKRAKLSQAVAPQLARGTAANANYGYSLPDTRYGPPKSRVQGFDGLLGTSARDDEGRALDQIKGLADGFSRRRSTE